MHLTQNLSPIESLTPAKIVCFFRCLISSLDVASTKKLKTTANYWISRKQSDCVRDFYEIFHSFGQNAQLFTPPIDTHTSNPPVTHHNNNNNQISANDFVALLWPVSLIVWTFSICLWFRISIFVPLLFLSTVFFLRSFYFRFDLNLGFFWWISCSVCFCVAIVSANGDLYFLLIFDW